MIKFYYNTAPNPTKVALCLEEMGLAYELFPIDTRKGEQHTPQFLAINPNAKVPAIVDGGTTVFDSNAILLYLAEKTGQFLPGKSLKEPEVKKWADDRAIELIQDSTPASARKFYDDQMAFWDPIIKQSGAKPE